MNGEVEMIKEKRNRHSDLQHKEKLQKYLDVLKEASALEKSGDKKAADRLFNDLKAQVEKEIAELESLYISLYISQVNP